MKADLNGLKSGGEGQISHNRYHSSKFSQKRTKDATHIHSEALLEVIEYQVDCRKIDSHNNDWD